MGKTLFMVVFSGDTIADYTVYENEAEAERIMEKKYSKYDCYVIHLPFKKVNKN